MKKKILSIFVTAVVVVMALTACSFMFCYGDACVDQSDPVATTKPKPTIPMATQVLETPQNTPTVAERWWWYPKAEWPMEINSIDVCYVTVTEGTTLRLATMNDLGGLVPYFPETRTHVRAGETFVVPAKPLRGKPLSAALYYGCQPSVGDGNVHMYQLMEENFAQVPGLYIGAAEEFPLFIRLKDVRVEKK